MSKSNSPTDADNTDPLDQTFNVDANGTPTNVRLVVEDDNPGMNNELSVTARLRGRRLSGTFIPNYPTASVGGRDDGHYLVEFDQPLHQYSTRFGDFIMGGATAVEIPDDVGDRICDHFDIDTLSERADEVADRVFMTRLRLRAEADEEFRDELIELLDRVE